MKKILLIASAALFFSASSAFAQFQGPDSAAGAGMGGFTGPGGPVATAAEAANMWDDSPVTLTGKIERGLGGDRYLFRDKSGTIMVEIDHDDWMGLTVGPNDVVLLSGDVDREFGGVRVDVERISKR